MLTVGEGCQLLAIGLILGYLMGRITAAVVRARNRMGK